MEKYFILKAKEWYMCFIKDTWENFEKFLSSEGIDIVGEEKTDVEDFGKVYTRLIKTEFDTMGESPELEEEIKEKMANLMLNCGDKLLADVFNEMSKNFDEISSAFASDVPIRAKTFTVLVSDGEKSEPQPNCYYVGDRHWLKFSDIESNEFWKFMARFGGCARIR